MGGDGGVVEVDETIYGRAAQLYRYRLRRRFASHDMVDHTQKGMPATKKNA
jgi:hypothetical protein